MAMRVSRGMMPSLATAQYLVSYNSAVRLRTLVLTCQAQGRETPTAAGRGARENHQPSGKQTLARA
jgi:hypothetical protein